MITSDLTEKDKLLKMVKMEIQALLCTEKEAITSYQLLRNYRTELNQQIPYMKLGYRSLENLLKSIPDVVFSTVDGAGILWVKAVPQAESCHINQLVAGQRKAKKKHASKSKPTFTPLNVHHFGFNRAAAAPRFYSMQWVNPSSTNSTKGPGNRYGKPYQPTWTASKPVVRVVKPPVHPPINNPPAGNNLNKPSTTWTRLEPAPVVQPAPKPVVTSVAVPCQRDEPKAVAKKPDGNIGQLPSLAAKSESNDDDSTQLALKVLVAGGEPSWSTHIEPVSLKKPAVWQKATPNISLADKASSTTGQTSLKQELIKPVNQRPLTVNTFGLPSQDPSNPLTVRPLVSEPTPPQERASELSCVKKEPIKDELGCPPPLEFQPQVPVKKICREQTLVDAKPVVQLKSALTAVRDVKMEVGNGSVPVQSQLQPDPESAQQPVKFTRVIPEGFKFPPSRPVHLEAESLADVSERIRYNLTITRPADNEKGGSRIVKLGDPPVTEASSSPPPSPESKPPPLVVQLPVRCNRRPVSIRPSVFSRLDTAPEEWSNSYLDKVRSLTAGCVVEKSYKVCSGRFVGRIDLIDSGLQFHTYPDDYGTANEALEAAARKAYRHLTHIPLPAWMS